MKTWLKGGIIVCLIPILVYALFFVFGKSTSVYILSILVSLPLGFLNGIFIPNENIFYTTNGCAGLCIPHEELTILGMIANIVICFLLGAIIGWVIQIMRKK